MHKDHHARLSALDWIGDELPDAKQLKSLPRKPLWENDPSPSGQKYTHWHVMALAKRDVPTTA